MDRLDSLSKYFQEKERKKLDSMIRASNNGIPTMSVLEIRQSCMENNGYETPELNDKLYLHFRGFKRIENLDEYTACKAIWLDSNGLDKIEGLSSLTELRCLYLGKNLISKIEGLDTLVNLHTLDLSNNRITTLENLSCCLGLKTILLGRNQLTTADSIRHVVDCQLLECIDVTNNQLDGEDVMSALAQVPALVTLSISGNEVCKLPSFRKRTIVAMPRLGYLDRPIDELERLAAVAFVNGGVEAETRAREDWREMQKKKRLNEALAFRTWQRDHAEQKRRELAEGKVLYKQMSEEEQLQYERELQEAREEEQRLRNKSVDLLSARHWDNGEEEEEDDAEEVEEVAVEEVEVVSEEAVPESEAEVVPVEVAVVPVEEQLVDDLVKRARAVELQEQREREERVTASLAIFKRQEEQRRVKDKENALNALAPAVVTPSPPLGTWEAALSTPDESKPFRVTLFWSLEMDLKLAALVKECMFDFDRVFLKMISAATDGEFGAIPKASIALISSDACRLRWCELDASQWSELAPNTDSTDAVYKICIDPADVSDGRGGQLSFDKLAAKSKAGGLPKYLVPPTEFPSVHADDDSSDDDEEDDDGIDLRSIALEMKRNGSHRQ